jgi:uncharacterized DUF497 family protein
MVMQTMNIVFNAGHGAKGRILIVVWTLREESVRLISAWHGALWVKANQPQRGRYEQQF